MTTEDTRIIDDSGRPMLDYGSSMPKGDREISDTGGSERRDGALLNYPDMDPEYNRRPNTSLYAIAPS